MGEIIAGIDVGTSKVSTVICRMNNLGTVDLLGKGMEINHSVKKGVITDIETAAAAIAGSVKKAEEMANVKITSAYTNIAGMHVQLIKNISSLPVSGNRREITGEDVDKLLIAAGSVPVDDNMEVIDVIPRQFVIDGMDEISDPIGMAGTRLEVDADVVAAKLTTLQSIAKSMQMAGIKLEGLVVEALATAEMVLHAEEKEKGVLMVDIGGGITDISIFRDKRLIYYNSIPVGGDHITSDLSIGLNISLSDAEKLKKQYEIALTSLIQHDQEVSLTDVHEGKRKNVKISEVVEIIEARMGEILALTREAVEKSEAGLQSFSNVVIVGRGVNNLDGVIQVAYEIFDVPVRIQTIKSETGMRGEYSTALGLIRHVLGENKKIIVNMGGMAGDRPGSSNNSPSNTRRKQKWIYRCIEAIKNFFS